jgi:mycobactin lysine-N-oxygenase
MTKRLLIVGAGPKAIAICAKARMLRENGLEPPEIVIVERAGIAANWTGGYGYTDGKRLLATSPVKDIGFPYRPGFPYKALGKVVEKKLKQRSSSILDGILCYSWAAYLIAISQYDDWIDRGWLRPTHAGFGDYLRWAARRCGIQIKRGEVTRIEPERGRWTVEYGHEQGGQLTTATEVVDGVVITGPGAPRAETAPAHPFISNGETFWQPPVLARFRALDQGRIAIIGGGDTSAVVATALLEALPQPHEVRIHIFTKTGLTFSRDIGHGATKYFSFPQGWESLPWQSRDELVRRTSENTVSDVSASILVRARNIEVRLGEVTGYNPVGKRIEIRIGTEPPEPYDRVIVATGFNPLVCRKLFPVAMFPHKLAYPAMIENVSKGILDDMSYTMPKAFGRGPRLHLPMLAARRQGPGFPTLECLGLVADRILSAYL